VPPPALHAGRVRHNGGRHSDVVVQASRLPGGWAVPSGTKILLTTYRYPAADDSSARVQQALEVMSKMEPIPDP